MTANELGLRVRDIGCPCAENRKKALLIGNITLSRNGKDEPIGDYAWVDLSDNRYVIEKLK